jgi:hypothetical protein
MFKIKLKWIVILIVVILGIGFFCKGEEMIIDSPSSPMKEINSFKREILVTKEHLKSSVPQSKKVDIGKDINITIETNLTMEPKMDSFKEGYNYIWKENGSIIGTGKYLTKSFSLGEHHIELEVYSNGSLIGRDEKLVVAWLYLKVENYYYSDKLDEYELYSREFFDHLKHLVLKVTPYSRVEYTYNEYGKVIEEIFESFNNINFNYIITYEYDEDRLVSMVTVNDDGKVIESHRYDEDEVEIVEPISDKEEKREDKQDKYKKIYNEDGNISRIVSHDGKYVINITYKDGKQVFTERIYPNGKNTIAKHYENNLLISYDSRSEDKEGNLRTRNLFYYTYNEKGEKIKKEMKQYIKEELVQHVVEKWHYKNGKVVLDEQEALIGVCPCSNNVVKSKSIYEYDKNGTELSYQYWYQKEGDSEMKRNREPKEVRSYTNILE